MLETQVSADALGAETVGAPSDDDGCAVEVLAHLAPEVLVEHLEANRVNQVEHYLGVKVTASMDSTAKFD